MNNRKSIYILSYKLIYIISLYIITLGTCYAVETNNDEPFKHVLLLQSYDPNHPWEKDVNDSISKVFEQTNMNIRLSVKYMDTKRSNTRQHYNNLLLLLKEELKNERFDLIIANDDNALKFAVKTRKTLFNNAPIVFCGLSHNPKELLKGQSDVTGIVQTLEFDRTLKLAQKMHPKNKNFIIINDCSSSGLKRRKQIFNAIEKQDKTLTFTFYDNLSMKELQDKLKNCKPNTTLLLHLFNHDRLNKYYSNREVFVAIRKYFKGPIYAVKKDYINYSIVGGYLSDGITHGTAVAKLAINILKNNNINTIPIVDSGIDVPAFSYPEIKRLKIDESLIPKNSKIYNKPFTFYEIYKNEIFVTIIIIILLIILILGLMAYIVQRNIADKKISNLKRYLANIINSMPSALIGSNRDGIITQWNIKAETLTQISGKEAIGKPLESVMPHLKPFIHDIKDALQESKVYVKRFNHRMHGSQQIKHEELTVYPLTDGVEGGVIRIDDITNKVETEKILIQSEKMASIAGLAAGMAHEINNPLAIIAQGIQNIQRRLDPTLPKNIEVAKKYGIDPQQMYKLLDERMVLMFLQGGNEAVERAAQIVKNMLMFARKNNHAKSKENIRKLIEQTIELGSTDYDMKKKYDFKHIEIETYFDDNIPDILCCSNEIEQVLLNLFKNALQAMENINSPDYKPKFHVRVMNEYKYVRIEIEDNGPGIPEDIQNRIFEPFFTTKPVGVGTGLGLSVSYMIITQNHNGKFEVESEVGKYTKFIIRLPI